MRAILFLYFWLVLYFFSNDLSAQIQKVNINVRGKRISYVFKLIEKKSKYSFLYDSSLINADSIINIHAKNKPISSILNDILPNNIGRIIRSNKIILLERESKLRLWHGIILSTDDIALPGVTLMVKGTSVGVSSNIDGLFAIKAKEGDVLLISFIGMKSLEHKLSKDNIVIQLHSSSLDMDEILITALGINKFHRAINYSTATLKGKAINLVKVPNLISSLSGRVAGVNIVSSFNLGGGNNIVIRGGSSISGDNQALFVLDGIPLNNLSSLGTETARGAGGYDFGNLSSDIGLENIEKVDILKGGASTALYGSRGANGVILLTSKKPKINKGIGISFSSSIILNKIDKSTLPDYQKIYGGGSMDTFSTQIINGSKYNLVEYSVDQSWGPKFDSSISVLHWDAFDSSDQENYLKPRPWQYPKYGPSEFFKTGSLIVNTLSLEQKTDKNSFRIFFSDTKDNATIDNSYLKKKNISFYGKLNLTDKFISIINAQYISVYAKNRPSLGYDWKKSLSFMGSAGMWMQTNVDYRRLRNYKRYDNGEMKTWNRTNAEISEPVFWENPYWTLNNNFPEDKRNRLISSFQLDYVLNKNISLKAIMSMDNFDYKIESRIKKGSYANSYYQKSMSYYSNYNYDFYLNYNKKVNNHLNISSILGFSKSINTQELLLASTKSGLLIDDFYSVSNSLGGDINTVDFVSEKIINSVFNITSLSYKNILFLDFTLRNDWSSTLPVNNNSYLYPSVSVSYVFNDIINYEGLSFAKLRANWAMVGNDTGFSRLDDTYRNYGNMSSTYRYGRNLIKNNKNLKPERVESIEIGLDLNFLNNRINIDLSYYEKYSRDLIIPSSVSITTGYYNQYMNIGAKSDKGLELSLQLNPIMTSKFSWNILCNWSTNKSKILALAEGLDSYVLNTNHVAVAAKVSHPYGVLIGSDFLYNNKGQKTINKNGFYKQSKNNKVLGNINPDWRGGISNSLRYKQLTFSFLLDFKMGGDLFSMTNYWGEQSGILKTTVGINDLGIDKRLPISQGGGLLLEGVYENGMKNTTRVETKDAFNASNRPKSSSIFDSSYIKLREVSLNYKMESICFSSFYIDEINLSLVSRNLLTLYKNVENIDPESSYGVSNIQGLELGSMPTYRSYGFSINVKF